PRIPVAPSAVDGRPFRGTEELRIAVGAFEVQVGVVFPGDGDTAVQLDRFGRDRGERFGALTAGDPYILGRRGAFLRQGDGGGQGGRFGGFGQDIHIG